MSARHEIHRNLEQYKKQAKDLLKAHLSGDAQAVALVRAHLPRLEGSTLARGTKSSSKKRSTSSLASASLRTGSGCTPFRRWISSC